MTTMKRQCAYCGNLEFLTREHIWPTSLVKKFKEQLITYNAKVDKFHAGEATIGDVCKICNNQNLSNLDNYLCSLYEKYFKEVLHPGMEVKIRFNYDKLLRVLLKISYNTTRAFNQDKESVEIQKSFSKYILGISSVKPKGVRLHLQIVTTSILVDENSDEVIVRLLPLSLRCGTINYDGIFSEEVIIRSDELSDL